MRLAQRRYRWFLASALLAFVLPIRAAEVDKYLPMEAEFVSHVNVKQLLDSPIVKKHAVDKLRDLLKGQDQASTVLEALGFDPFKDLASVTIAGSSFENDGKGFIILHGNFDAAKFDAKAEEEAKTHGDVLKIHKEGDKKIYEVQHSQAPGSDQPLFVAVVDKTTAVASSEKDYVKTCVAGKKEAGVKKELKELIDKADGKSSLWLVVRGSLLNGGRLGGLQDEKSRKITEKIDSFSFSVTVDKGVSLAVAAGAKNSDAAKELAEEFKDKLDQGKGLLVAVAGMDQKLAPLVEVVNSVKIVTEGNSVTFKGEVSEELVEKALKDQN